MKKKRGCYESAISKDDGVIIVKWMDYSIVPIVSNNLGVQPVSTDKQFFQKDKTISCFRFHVRPFLFGEYEYNKYIGGVDRIDENVIMYRIHIRSKIDERYWSLMTWMLDA